MQSIFVWLLIVSNFSIVCHQTLAGGVWGRDYSMPNVAAYNLTLDEATDDPPADAATDNMAEESTHSDKGPTKQNQLIMRGLMRRD